MTDEKLDFKAALSFSKKELVACLLLFCRNRVSYFEDNLNILRTCKCFKRYNPDYLELQYKKLTMSLFVVCKKGEMKQ